MNRRLFFGGLVGLACLPFGLGKRKEEKFFDGGICPRSRVKIGRRPPEELLVATNGDLEAWYRVVYGDYPSYSDDYLVLRDKKDGLNEAVDLKGMMVCYRSARSMGQWCSSMDAIKKESLRVHVTVTSDSLWVGVHRPSRHCQAVGFDGLRIPMKRLNEAAGKLKT